MRDAVTMPGGMVLCMGCGFHVEPEDVVERVVHHGASDACVTCTSCKTEPRLKESYRRGYNAGLDAMARAVTDIAQTSGLRRRPGP